MLIMIRVVMDSTAAAVKDYGTWMTETDKGGDQNCLEQLASLKRLDKQAILLRDLFNKVFDHICDKEAKKDEEVPAPAPTKKINTQTDLDDLF